MEPGWSTWIGPSGSEPPPVLGGDYGFQSFD